MKDILEDNKTYKKTTTQHYKILKSLVWTCIHNALYNTVFKNERQSIRTRTCQTYYHLHGKSEMRGSFMFVLKIYI